jgi:transglutaminase-like putative cysteine protease
MVFLGGMALTFIGLGDSDILVKSEAKSNDSHGQRQFRFWYEVKVKNIPSSSKRMKVWLPIPSSNVHQTVSDLKVITPLAYTIYQENEYYNKILRLETEGRVPESLAINVSFSLSRSPYSAWGKTELTGADTTEETLQRYLSPDRLIPVTGQIKEEAEKVATKEMSDLEKAKAIYEYVSGNLSYDKSGTGWGRGDAIFACNARQGNCTDFHSLFIGMARAVGIPARFVMGFPVPQDKSQGKVSGYHCWAEFYVKGIGWVPVDASEASKFPELQEFYFGNLDPNRVEFSIGRDIQLDPAVEPQNFFIYPVVVVDNSPYADVQTLFHFSSN